MHHTCIMQNVFFRVFMIVYVSLLHAVQHAVHMCDVSTCYAHGVVLVGLSTRPLEVVSGMRVTVHAPTIPAANLSWHGNAVRLHS